MKFVRIVILNYNNSQYTLDLIENLRTQTYLNFEIIIVDNNSRASEIKILEDQISDHIGCIYSKINLGYAGGNNLGLRYENQKNPDLFFVLNNDVIIKDNDLLLKMVKTFDEHRLKPIYAVSPLIDTISSNIPLEKQIQVRKVLSTFQMYIICCSIFKLFTKKLFAKYIYKNSMPFIDRYLDCESINGAAFMIENEFLKSNNYLDEGTFLFFEEIILGRQIKDLGGICILNGYTSLEHFQGVSTKSNLNKYNFKMENYKIESELYYFKKYCRLGSFYSLLYVFFKKTEMILKLIIYKFI
jgi:GT2 family glycosyltransferase